ncbi:hypothetical protein GY14_20275 [Delftia tsuruhatensis]|nr:hypothetical protein GY14_20275 [Delftia tsuruhatensis]
MDHHVDRLGDQRTRRVHRHFENQLLQAQQRAERGAGVDRGDTARMAGAPHLDEIQRLGAAHLADDDAIRPQAHGRPHQFGHGHDAGARAQRHMVAGRALQLDGVFEHQYAVARGGDLGQQRIGERGLAAARGSCDQDVLALAHGANEKARLLGGHHSVLDVARQRDDADGALAQREGRPRRSGRQDALEAFAGFGQLGGQQRLPAMDFCANVGRDQADDSLAVRLRQLRAHRRAPTGKPIHPKGAIGVQHHLHHVRVFERGGDQRPHRRAQHLDAAVERGGEG